MQLNSLRTDDSAVSPVIGVILMVAITVILAAVIATFVLGLGDELGQTAPQANFATQYDSADGLTITHDGGDSIPAEELHLRGDVDLAWMDLADGGNSEVAAGNSITIDSDDVSGDIDGVNSVTVVWDNGNGNSATFTTWERSNT